MDSKPGKGLQGLSCTLLQMGMSPEKTCISLLALTHMAREREGKSNDFLPDDLLEHLFHAGRMSAVQRGGVGEGRKTEKIL